MTRCQSELDPVVDARCDARRRREDETGWTGWTEATRRAVEEEGRAAGSPVLACLLACLRAVGGRPFPGARYLGIWEGHRTVELSWAGAREGLQMAMLRCRSGRLSMFCSEPCMSGASRFRPGEVL